MAAACPDSEVFARFAEQTLDEGERRALETHVGGCPACRRVVGALAHMIPEPSHLDAAPTRSEKRVCGTWSGEAHIGTLVAGRYRIESPLGAGGMGCVWRARDEKLRRFVAVKMIAEGYELSKEARDRFEREAMAVAALNSPHIVQIYDYGVDGELPFMVMEMLEGEDLLTRLDKEGAMSLAHVAELVLQTARALDVAHEAGIMHRDLKPGNIFMQRDQDRHLVKVVDFGLSKGNALPLPDSELTSENALLGTPAYMSPEQVHAAREVDTKTDLWSLGVIAYRALTLELPFAAKSVGGLMVKICTQEPRPIAELLPEAPRGLDAFFARALAKEPEQRFQTAAELAAEFAAIAGLDPESGRWSLPGRGGPGEEPASDEPASDEPAPAVESAPRGAATIGEESLRGATKTVDEVPPRRRVIALSGLVATATLAAVIWYATTAGPTATATAPSGGPAATASPSAALVASSSRVAVPTSHPEASAGARAVAPRTTPAASSAPTLVPAPAVSSAPPSKKKHPLHL